MRPDPNRTAVVKKLIEKHTGGLECNFDPRADGAFRATVSPIAVRDVKLRPRFHASPRRGDQSPGAALTAPRDARDAGPRQVWVRQLQGFQDFDLQAFHGAGVVILFMIIAQEM